MKHLEDIKEVGHGIAVAFVATVYGVGSANILFLPAANKMRVARARRRRDAQSMMLEGVLGIAEGLNPKLIRIKLEAYTCPAAPKKGRKGSLAAAGRPVEAAAGD